MSILNEIKNNHLDIRSSLANTRTEATQQTVVKVFELMESHDNT